MAGVIPSRKDGEESPSHVRGGFLAALGMTLVLSCTPHETRPRNVLLITLDTFRADRIGVHTPNLNRFAQRAAVFANAEAAVPLTLPSHATILSGLLPLHHGVRTNGAAGFPSDKDTLATTLKAAGYRTGAFVGSFVLDHRFGLAHGFDSYDDAIERSISESDSSFDVERRGSVVVDHALQWLKTSDARPFFAWIHLYDAHTPYAPPAPYPQTYDGEIAYVDAQVERLLRAVNEDTIVAVVADHGEALGEHGELTHGLLLYEPTLHVPMLIAGPSIKPQRIDEAVSTVDVAPTLAGLAGTMMRVQDGRDLSAQLRNGRALPPADVYAETQYPLAFGWSELAALRRDTAKLISGGTTELFDLRSDAGETRNVAADQRRELRQLDAQLTRIRSSAVASRSARVDPETAAKLQSLGYVAPAQSAAGGARPDPRAMAPLLADFEKASALTRSGDTGGAIALLQQAVDRDPANSVFRGALARAKRQAGDADAAATLYREAVALAPSDADAWYNLGVLLHEIGKDTESLAALDEAVRLDPNRAEAHDARGVAQITAGDVNAAAQSFIRAAEIDPLNARTWNNLGNAFRALGRAGDAAAAYQKAAALAPQFPDPLNGLGALLVQTGKPRDAIALFERALAIAPDYYEAQLNKGIALQEAGDAAGAAAEYRGLLARLPRKSAFDAQRNAARTLLSRIGN